MSSANRLTLRSVSRSAASLPALVSALLILPILTAGARDNPATGKKNSTRSELRLFRRFGFFLLFPADSVYSEQADRQTNGE